MNFSFLEVTGTVVTDIPGTVVTDATGAVVTDATGTFVTEGVKEALIIFCKFFK